jgi:hypothetical protein
MAMGIYDLVSSVPSWTEFDGSNYGPARNFTVSCVGDVSAASAQPFDFRTYDFPVECTAGAQALNQSYLDNSSNWTVPSSAMPTGPGILLGCTLSQGYRMENFTTTVGFVDDRREDFNLTVPDSSGSFLTTGSLNDIDRIGVLTSPIVGQADATSLTRIVFGDNWTYSNVTISLNQLSIVRELHGFVYCAATDCNSLTCDFPLLSTSWKCGSSNLAATSARPDAFVIDAGGQDRCIIWYVVNGSLDDNRPPLGSLVKLDEMDGSIFTVTEIKTLANSTCAKGSKATCANGFLKMNNGGTSYYASHSLQLCLIPDLVEASIKSLIGGQATIQSLLTHNLSLGVLPIASIVDDIQLAMSKQFGKSRASLNISFAPSGWGWEDHKQGANISIDNFEDRRIAQSATAPGFSCVSGWGSCLVIPPGTSKDPRKFHCATTSPSVAFSGSFSNATGRARAGDCFLIRTGNNSWPGSLSSQLAAFAASYYPASTGLELLMFDPDIGAQESYWSPLSGITMSAIRINATRRSIRGVTATRFGSPVVNNTIYIPSSGDGMIVSTGNLKDVTLKSSRITSLAINPYAYGNSSTALLVNGYLEFGYMESGWSYESPTTRVRNMILFSGPGLEFVQAADDISGKYDIPGLNRRLAEKNVYQVLTGTTRPFNGTEQLANYLVQQTGISADDASVVAQGVLRRCNTFSALGACGNGASAGFIGTPVSEMAQGLQKWDYSKLGSSNFSSGIRLLLEANKTYAGLPFQIDTLSGPTLKVLEISKNAPQVGGGRLALVTVPSANGTVLTTANLEDITHGDGDIQSLSVAGRSWFDSQVLVGSDDPAKQGMLLASDSMLWTGSGSATKISFSTTVRDQDRGPADGWVSTNIVFPFETGGLRGTWAFTASLPLPAEFAFWSTCE